MFDEPRRRRAGLSLVPLIDVVFQLLIFFMLTSSFLQTQGLTMLTPAGDAGAAPCDANVIEFWVMADGALRVDGAPVATDAAADLLRKTVGGDRSRIVSILVEKGVATQAVVTALEVARASGAGTIGTARVERLAP